jgi:hypothetical protein|tara:strand:- start:1436 stop:2065 length:630 start_codon:yes stop_codon:yes gene_type:complete
MPTIEYIVNKKKVPGVTTILSRFKLSTPLIIWANRLGLEGKDYFKELNKAGDIGTELHNLAELHIKNEHYDLPEDETVKNCFNQFLDWWDKSNYQVTWTEKPYASKKLFYGGCPDLLVNGNTLIDFKTSKGIYLDYLIQLSAYAALIKEVDGIEIEQAIIVRFPKDNDTTEFATFSKADLKAAFKQFKLFRKAFDIDKDLNKLMRKKNG